MKTTSKISISAICPMALVAIILFAPGAFAQVNYTVGDNIGEDHSAYSYAPFWFEGLSGEQEYHDHVGQDLYNTCGQHYDGESDCWETWEPNPAPSWCLLEDFVEIIGNSTDYLGVLLVTSHGNENIVAVEAYAGSSAGVDACTTAYNEYLAMGYTTSEIMYGQTISGFNFIGVTDQFIRKYGNLNQSLVFAGSCHGGSLVDDFVAAGARLALGNPGSMFPDDIGQLVDIFFTGMDGKYGFDYRPASMAMSGLGLASAGQLNTTLTPAVRRVDIPNPLKLYDTIRVVFDTKCNTHATPYIMSDYGYVCPEVWGDDSLTIKAEFCELPPAMIDEIQFTLTWDYVWSARNWACLDGNTDPPNGNNAEGPVPDDYIWTWPVAPCNCGTLWGDLDCSSKIDPVDVVYLVNYVYRSLDALCKPNDMNCPYMLGDFDCSGDISPVDVVYFVNYVYKNALHACLDPCW